MTVVAPAADRFHTIAPIPGQSHSGAEIARPVAPDGHLARIQQYVRGLAFRCPHRHGQGLPVHLIVERTLNYREGLISTSPDTNVTSQRQKLDEPRRTRRSTHGDTSGVYVRCIALCAAWPA